MMIDKGIQKNLSRIHTERSKTARKWYLRTKFFRQIAFFGLFTLSFVEKPHWCMTNPETKQDSQCVFQDNPRKYPTSGMYYLQPFVSQLLDISFLVTINIFTLLKG